MTLLSSNACKQGVLSKPTKFVTVDSALMSVRDVQNITEYQRITGYPRATVVIKREVSYNTGYQKILAPAIGYISTGFDGDAVWFCSRSSQGATYWIPPPSSRPWLLVLSSIHTIIKDSLALLDTKDLLVPLVIHACFTVGRYWSHTLACRQMS